MQQVVKAIRVVECQTRRCQTNRLPLRVRDIKQEDIGIFRVELVAEALPDPRGFEVVHHPIEFKLATRDGVMSNCLSLWGIGVPNVCLGQEIQLTIRPES
jgi:hypothetical protein